MKDTNEYVVTTKDDSSDVQKTYKDTAVDPAAIANGVEAINASPITSAEDIKNMDLSKYNFADLYNMRKHANADYQNIEDMHERINRIREYYGDCKYLSDEATKDVMASTNLTEDYINNLFADIYKYESEYKQNKENMITYLSRIQTEMDTRYPDVENKISFIDKEMIESLKSKKEKMHESLEAKQKENNAITEAAKKNGKKAAISELKNTANEQTAILRISRKINAINDRCDMNYWKSVSKHVGAVKRLEKSFRTDFKKSLGFTYKNLKTSSMDVKNIMLIQIYIHDICGSALLTRFFMYHIATLINKDSNNGEAANAQVMLSTLQALVTNTFDFVPEDEMCVKINDIINNYKSIISDSTYKMFARDPAYKADEALYCNTAVMNKTGESAKID